MIVKVESCWGGGDRYQRLTLPDGLRLTIQKEDWNRKAASEALDLIGVERPRVLRKSIRFNVV